MPKPRTPTNILKFKGAFDKDPQRAASRIHEPAPKGEIGKAPAHMSDYQAKIWDEVVALCCDGVLCGSDRLIVEATVFAISAMRVTEGRDPKLISLVNTLCQQLGMTPSARSKVQAAPTVDGPNAKPTFASV